MKELIESMPKLNHDAKIGFVLESKGWWTKSTD